MIRMVPDVGAPLAVTAIDLVTETAAPEWNEWAAYGVTGVAYGMALVGRGPGEFVKNMGIAAFPWAAKKLYSRVRAGMGGKPLGSRLVMKPVNRIATNKPEWASTRLS